MNKTEMLFIRACKSKEPLKRLETLHKRIYVHESAARTENNLISELSNICQNYDLIGVADLIREMSRAKDRYCFFTKKEISFQKLCLDVLISAIRFAEADIFTGFIPPARFK